MAASTKLVLVLVTLLLGVSVLFYGVMFDGEDPLEVARSQTSAAGDGDADGERRRSDDAEAAPRGGSGERSPLAAAPARTERPAPGAGASRPALAGTATPSTPTGSAADSARRPSLGAAARTVPGQIEMGAARGPLAGGTRLPLGVAASDASDPPDAPDAPDAGSGAAETAAPLERPESAGPATARPPLRASSSGPAARSARTEDDRPAGAGASAAPAPRPAPAPGSAGPAAARPERPARPEDVLAGTWTVQPGDTLAGIARAWFGTERHWRLIADANPEADPRRLRVGQRLDLPPKAQAAKAERDRVRAEAAAAERATPDPAVRPGERVHVVAAGESLSAIAQRYYGAAARWRLIAERNDDLLGGDPDRLAVGMKLRIPPAPAEG